jgi:hypothetical protein
MNPWKSRYVDDGWLKRACAGCGERATIGEEIEVIQVSSSEGLWMHPPCAQRYDEWCEKEEEGFYTDKVLKFVRGEGSGIEPGTVGEERAKIAKDLVAKTPSLALPENLRELMATVEAVEHAIAMANGYVITDVARGLHGRQLADAIAGSLVTTLTNAVTLTDREIADIVEHVESERAAHRARLHQP